ncbi:unnamed protein product [Adineta steineri]|uniref:DALR anticodon binding domain-containing protein n=1 Tax=Adineta steineri TaxID=433720 RepID=A0A815BAV1_9BILA|nr:unnamed protein product [Adineta steineri]
MITEVVAFGEEKKKRKEEQLRKCINRALATLYVKDEELELAKARLLLYHMCRLSLKEGLELLGIEALTRI